MSISPHPYAKLLGIQVTREESGSATVQIRAADHHTNVLGYVHGGLVYSLADVAFELASNSHEVDAVGITTNMQFHRAAKSGDLIVAKATEIHLGRKLATYSIEVSCEDRLLASFTGTVYRLDGKST